MMVGKEAFAGYENAYVGVQIYEFEYSKKCGWA